MIRGVHTMYYSSEPEALRTFIRDQLGFPGVDVGEGWMIFDLPAADMGVHPTRGDPANGTQYLSFYCDDVHESMRQLQARGVEFIDDVSEAGYGLAAHFKMPGGLTAELYQPHYRTLGKLVSDSVR